MLFLLRFLEECERKSNSEEVWLRRSKSTVRKRWRPKVHKHGQSSFTDGCCGRCVHRQFCYLWISGRIVPTHRWYGWVTLTKVLWSQFNSFVDHRNPVKNSSSNGMWNLSYISVWYDYFFLIHTPQCSPFHPHLSLYCCVWLLTVCKHVVPPRLLRSLYIQQLFYLVYLINLTSVILMLPILC